MSLAPERVNEIRLRSLRGRLKVLRSLPGDYQATIAELEAQIAQAEGK